MDECSCASVSSILCKTSPQQELPILVTSENCNYIPSPDPICLLRVNAFLVSSEVLSPFSRCTYYPFITVTRYCFALPGNTLRPASKTVMHTPPLAVALMLLLSYLVYALAHHSLLNGEGAPFAFKYSSLVIAVLLTLPKSSGAFYTSYRSRFITFSLPDCASLRAQLRTAANQSFFILLFASLQSLTTLK